MSTESDENVTPNNKGGPLLIGVLDCGTRTCEFVVFRAQHTEPLAGHQIDLKQVSLSEGWLEEDPLEMLRSLDECVKEVGKKLPMHGYHIEDVRAIGTYVIKRYLDVMKGYINPNFFCSWCFYETNNSFEIPAMIICYN